MIIGGLTLGSSTAAHAQAGARASTEAVAAEAQGRADDARHRANELARAGGWAYKTGLAQQAERDAARYQAEADQAYAEAHACPVSGALAPSPALSAALARLEELRQAGGWVYKTGAVTRAEQDVRSLTAREEAEPVTLSPAQVAALARLEELRRSGGWAYKTGAVASVEHEVQRSLASARAPSVCDGRQATLGSLTASAR